jgi:cell division transport system permease protein
MRPKLRKNYRRLAQMSLQNISRNLLLSIATTVMMALILFIFNVIIVLNILTAASLDAIGDKVDLLLYVSESASLYEITEMTADLESIPVVKSITYTSKEAALEEFLTLYPDQETLFTDYGIENPLPANIQVITDDPSQHSMVTDYLEASAYSDLLMDIESSDENQEIVSRLMSVTNFTEKLIIGVIVTFIFGSLLMIMNAIHLSIFTRKREIQVMQLVGAKQSMIRFPFMLEGALYSIIAVLFSFLLLIIFLEGTDLASFANFQENFKPGTLLGLELLGSTLVGLISSFIAITYYLKRTLVIQK